MPVVGSLELLRQCGRIVRATAAGQTRRRRRTDDIRLLVVNVDDGVMSDRFNTAQN
jgi:hypothetical protein